MPEYDPTDAPAPLLADLTETEAGGWPASPPVPQRYAGPPPSREFETSGLGRAHTARPLAPDPAPGAPQTLPIAVAPPTR